MNKQFILILIWLTGSIASACAQPQQPDQTNYTMATEKAVFAGGCFWCTEAIFERTKGVEKVLSGYTGGNIKNPTYREVTSGRTGHAEAVMLHYNPEVISFEELLLIFFKTHNPTTLNQQGADVGTQYRSGVFYLTPEQKQQAEQMIQRLEEENIWTDPIVTEVTAFDAFYEAEDYHQNFYDNNKSHPYCNVVINPKLNKLEREFSEHLKE